MGGAAHRPGCHTVGHPCTSADSALDRNLDASWAFLCRDWDIHLEAEIVRRMWGFDPGETCASEALVWVADPYSAPERDCGPSLGLRIAARGNAGMKEPQEIGESFGVV